MPYREVKRGRLGVAGRAERVLGAGDHQVVFDFVPRPFYTGMWISTISWLAIVIAGLVALALFVKRSRLSDRQFANPVTARASGSR